MLSRPKRRFTLMDAGALIAATAIGLALVRPALIALEKPIMISKRWPWIDSCLAHLGLYATPVLAAWSVTTLALSLRQPRPVSRFIIRSPGFVMNTAAIAGLLCSSILFLGQIVVAPSGAEFKYARMIDIGLASVVGYAVIGSLVALTFFRRLRPGPLWTDRLGWALGWVWVGMLLLTWARLCLFLIG